MGVLPRRARIVFEGRGVLGATTFLFVLCLLCFGCGNQELSRVRGRVIEVHKWNDGVHVRVSVRGTTDYSNEDYTEPYFFGYSPRVGDCVMVWAAKFVIVGGRGGTNAQVRYIPAKDRSIAPCEG